MDGCDAEITENRKTASILLQNGFKNIKLLPQIHASETELRKRYFGKDYTSEGNPDAVVDGKMAEFKVTNFRNFSIRLSESVKKSEFIVIRLTEKLTRQYVENKLKNFRNKSFVIINIDEVFVYKY